MPRARPVHNLQRAEQRMVDAIAAPDSGRGDRARALRLKHKIEAYWRARGHAVCISVTTIAVPNGGAQTRAAYVLVSDTVNGLPRSGAP